MTEYVIVEKSELTAVADAIRTRTGSTEMLTLENMPVAISEMRVVETLEDAEEMEF